MLWSNRARVKLAVAFLTISLFNTPIESNHGELIEILVHEKLLEKEGSFIRLSRRGAELADSVIENFAIGV